MYLRFIYAFEMERVFAADVLFFTLLSRYRAASHAPTATANTIPPKTNSGILSDNGTGFGMSVDCSTNPMYTAANAAVMPAYSFVRRILLRI